MQRASRLVGLALRIAVPGLLCNLHPSMLHGQGELHRYRQVHMGVEVSISIHASEEIADHAAAKAFARIAVLDSILSDWRRDSELNRLSDSAGGEWQPVSAELMAVLALAVEVATASDGAFDPTVGAMTLLWRRERQTGVRPHPDSLDAARATVDWRSIHLDPAHRLVRLGKRGTRLDLGGIAKGWILERAREVMADNGAAAVLLEAGGDLVAGNPPPGAPGWRVAVWTMTGDSVVLLRNSAMAVSGPAFQSITRSDGTVLSHVIDPATGEGLRSNLEVTVRAANGAVADAIATALTVMPAERWWEFLQYFSAELLSPSLP